MNDEAKPVRPEQYEGFCTVCGNWTRFDDVQRSIRETYQCKECRASMRDRVLAAALLMIFGRGRHKSVSSLAQAPWFSELKIYEPGLIGPFRRVLKGHPGYVNSFYWDGLARGEMRDGVQHQDLMNLSFPDSSFDLMISSDIFEHIRKPVLAFRESKRILKNGGVHIFTVPSSIPMRIKNQIRVDTSTEKDEPLMEAHYHGDGAGGRSLVYTDFGYEMIAELEAIGFRTLSVNHDHTDAARMKVNAFAAIAMKELDAI